MEHPRNWPVTTTPPQQGLHLNPRPERPLLAFQGAGKAFGKGDTTHSRKSPFHLGTFWPLGHLRSTLITLKQARPQGEWPAEKLGPENKEDPNLDNLDSVLFKPRENHESPQISQEEIGVFKRLAPPGENLQLRRNWNSWLSSRLF